MVITYFGKSYFKLTLGDLTIAINPPSKASKAPRFGSDIVLVTTNHPDYSDIETVTLGSKEPFIVDGPGSFESQGLLFTGAMSKAMIDKKEFINTVYGFELDGIKIGFMGIISDESTLSPEAKEILGASDMIFVPIGGGHVFDPSTAYKVATSFGPNVVIPYEYDKDTLQKFLKEGGQEKNEAQEKATLKRRDLDGKEGNILVLEPQA